MRKSTQKNIWYGVLTYSDRELPKRPPRDIQAMFYQFVVNHYQAFRQFTVYPTIVKPVKVAKGVVEYMYRDKPKKKYQVTYENHVQHKFTDLKNPIYYLVQRGEHRHFNFGQVFLLKKPVFALLLRYYVFSTVTGADHIFYLRTTGNKNDSLYPQLQIRRLLFRPDTCGLLEWYLNLVYLITGKKRSLDTQQSPSADLEVMVEYWSKYQNA